MMRAMVRFKRTDEDLHELAKGWFAEARKKSAQDEAEFEAWNKERPKLSPLGFGRRSDGFDWDLGGGGGDSGGGFG